MSYYDIANSLFIFSLKTFLHYKRINIIINDYVLYFFTLSTNFEINVSKIFIAIIMHIFNYKHKSLIFKKKNTIFA